MMTTALAGWRCADTVRVSLYLLKTTASLTCTGSRAGVRGGGGGGGGEGGVGGLNGRVNSPPEGLDWGSSRGVTRTTMGENPRTGWNMAAQR